MDHPEECDEGGRGERDETPTSEAEAIATAVSDPVFRFGVEDRGTFRFEGGNQVHWAQTNLDPADSCGKTPRELYGDQAGEQLREKLGDCVETGERLTCEISVTVPAGTLDWELRLAPVVADGSVQTVVCVGSQPSTETDSLPRRERTHWLHRLFEKAPDGILIHDSAGNILDANDPLVDMLGYSREELCSMTVTDIEVGIEPDTLAKYWATVGDGPTERIEVDGRHRRKDGSTVPVAVWVSKLVSENHQRDRFIAFVRDVSERQAYKRELEAREEKYRSLFSESRDALLLLDGDTIVEVNRAAVDLYGADSPAALSGRSPAELSPAEQPDGRNSETAAREYIDRALSAGSAFFEWTHCREDGTTFDAEVKLSRFEVAGDELVHALIRDVTDRKQRERELERHRAYVENSTDIITLIDPDGTLQFVSPAVERVLGVTPEEFVGNSLFSTVHPEDRGRVRSDLERLVADDAAETVLEYRVQCSDEDYCWIESNARNMLDDPEVGAILLSSREITARKEYEQQLAALHEATRSLLQAETAERVAQTAVEAASEMLDFTLPSIWQPDGEETRLELVANTPEHQRLLDDAPEEDPFHPRDGWLWDVYQSGDTVVRSPIPADDLAANVPLESVLLLPMGEHGVLACAARERVEFGDREVRLAETLARNVRVGFEQIERRRALEQQQEFTADLLDAIEDVAYVLDSDGNLVLWNAALEELFDQSGLELESRNLSELLTGATLERVQAAVTEAFDTGHTRVEFDVPTGDGELIPYEFTGNVFEAQDGEPVLAGIGRDRSLHIEYERELEAERDFLNTIIQSVPFPFYVLNVDDYSVEHANSEAVVQPGETCYELTHSREQPCHQGERAVDCPIPEIENTGEPVVVEHAHLDESGAERHFQVHAAPILDDEGNVIQIAESTVDITDRVETQRELETQRDNLEILNEVVRHDIRNDLQLVQVYAELLEEHVEDEGEAYLEKVHESAKSAVGLTTTARELAEVMLQPNVENRTVSFGETLEQQVEEVRSTHSEAIITVDGSFPRTGVLANEMLSSVFRNLLHNAVQHNDAEVPEVTVTAAERDEHVEARIADNGPGIPDDQKEDIFGKGEKGLESAGTGLGLYLVQSLVEGYGGSVWVEDNDPEGSMFVVRLPVAE